MPKKKKKARGRPYAGGETPKRFVRIKDADFQLMKAEAARAGETTSEWMRRVLLKAVGRE